MKVCPQVLDFQLIGDLIKLTTKNSDHRQGFMEKYNMIRALQTQE